MKINIKADGFELTPAIQDYIEKKLESLQKVLQRFDDEGLLNIDFEVAKTTRHHQKGDIFYAEANLELPKKLIRAEKNDEDLFAAIDGVKEIMSESVKKYKELME